MGPPTYPDIFKKLFSFNLDEFLQGVFLYLDPASLKNCRCVCRQWNGFINRRLWTSIVARRKLRTRLNFLWKNGSFNISEFAESKGKVYCIASDDNYVYCGTVNGFTEVYDVASGHLKFNICCKADASVGVEVVQFDIGEDCIAAMTESGNISIWDKESGELRYKAKHHGEHISVFGIKVMKKIAVTGAGDGSLFLLEKSKGGEWKIKSKIYHNKEEITHIDIDEAWLVTGTRSFIKLWNLAELEQGPRPDPIAVSPWMFIFHFPFIFVVGGELWEGFQVWNVETGRKIRDIQLNSKKFHTISSNGDFIVISEIVELWPGDEAEDVFIFVFDIKELCDEAIPDVKLWRRVRICEQSYDGGEVNAAINKTSLLVSHGTNVNIQCFWNDKTLAG